MRYLEESRDSAVGVEPEFVSRWGQEFSLLHVFLTSSGVQPASYTVGTGGKVAGA
jgi:hypothetical protein